MFPNIKIMGFSLIEILISLLLLSFLLMGFATLDMLALRKIQRTYFLSLARMQLNNISERLRASGGSSTTMIDWNRENAALLPAGHGNITSQFSHYQMTLVWGHAKNSNCLITDSSGCLTEKITLASP